LVTVPLVRPDAVSLLAPDVLGEALFPFVSFDADELLFELDGLAPLPCVDVSADGVLGVELAGAKVFAVV
jgi:hypothetical protein